MNIAIAGTGYVGLANAVLLAQHHHVTAVDLVAEKVDKINRRVSPETSCQGLFNQIHKKATKKVPEALSCS